MHPPIVPQACLGEFSDKSDMYAVGLILYEMWHRFQATRRHGVLHGLYGGARMPQHHHQHGEGTAPIPTCPAFHAHPVSHALCPVSLCPHMPCLPMLPGFGTGVVNAACWCCPCGPTCCPCPKPLHHGSCVSLLSMTTTHFQTRIVVFRNGSFTNECLPAWVLHHVSQHSSCTMPYRSMLAATQSHGSSVNATH